MMLKKILSNIRVIVLGISFCIFVMMVSLLSWGIYEYYAYRYVVEQEGKFIYDKQTKEFLMVDGQSFYKEGDYIYAYKDGLFLIIDNSKFQKNSTIIAYIERKNDTSENYIDYNNRHYNNKNKIILDSRILSPRQLKIYNQLKRVNNAFISQGIM